MINHLSKTVHRNGIIVIGGIDMQDGVIENLNRLSLDRWSFDLNEEGELCINYDDEVKARITNNNEITINLHCERYFMVQPVNVDRCIGLLVSNLPRYYNLDITQRATNRQALPSIYLTAKPYDPAIIGVIVDYEKYERTYNVGNISSVSHQEDDLNRVLVTNRGTSAIWVCDINGYLKNGEYITSSGIPGYGMRQEDDVKHNYTIGKMTQECNFNPGFILMEKPVDFDENGPIYEPIKSVNQDIITDVEYEMKYINIDGKEVTLHDFTNDLQSIAGDGEDLYIFSEDQTKGRETKGRETRELRPDLLEHPNRTIFRTAKVGCSFT